MLWGTCPSSQEGWRGLRGTDMMGSRFLRPEILELWGPCAVAPSMKVAGRVAQWRPVYQGLFYCVLCALIVYRVCPFSNPTIGVTRP